MTKKRRIAKLLGINESEILEIKTDKIGDIEVSTAKGSFVVTPKIESFYQMQTCGEHPGNNATGHYLPASGGPY
ncbi:hypothetical protein ACFL2R_01620 [Patescibacteria group bacterium]